ncbi:MAG TPA: OpgC domain-containing protein [Terriglobales bacterium]|nr:OpgC domain-containing protein [Terriglobales bacterium]
MFLIASLWKPDCIHTLMGRDWRVDTLRGYFLVLMTLGHFPNPLARYSEYSFGYAAAPDGFVFLAGLVSAWVYLPLAQQRGLEAMTAKVFRRTRAIYLCHVALITLGIIFTLQSGAQSFRASHPIRAFVLGSLLLQQGGFDKILPMYCVFLALTPWLLKQFIKGRAGLIGIVSAGLWTAAQFGLGDNSHRLAWMDLGTFNLCAWQAYFVAGQYLGYRSVNSPAFKVLRSRALLGACLVIAALLMLDRHLIWLAGHPPLLGFSAHPNHNPARLLDAACLAYILWFVPRAVDRRLMPVRVFKFFNLLGRHSLQVFMFSMVIARFEAHTITTLPVAAKLVLTILTVLSLALPAWIHQRYQSVRAPGPLGAAVPLRPQPAA